MKTVSLILSCLLAILCSALPLVGSADDKAELIKLARSAGPAAISDKATIVYQGEVLVEGSNGWTCGPEVMPGDKSPHCSDKTWMELMKAAGEKSEFSPKTIGISYMLAGDGVGVSNTDPYHHDPVNAEDYVREGPHIMLVVPREMLQGITDNPGQGGPYVMWKDTPYAHIMVPITGD